MLGRVYIVNGRLTETWEGKAGGGVCTRQEKTKILTAPKKQKIFLRPDHCTWTGRMTGILNKE